MRRSPLTVIAAVSLGVLVSTATSALAITSPTMNLGLLKPQEQWKVGTVNADGAAYCAMVGKFEKQVVLAFAKSPEGFNSVAMDFRESFFEPGSEYEVSLKVDKARARQLVGRASSDRSVVVQIGQDDKFFDALNTAGNLQIGMPTIDVSFALRKFSASYKNLAKCASQLSGDAAQVEKSDLTPIDREVRRLDDEQSQIAGAESEVRKIQDALERKTGGFDDIEDQLTQEAEDEQERASSAIEQIDEEREELAEDIADKKEEVDGIEAKRKLIASAKGVNAKNLERQQRVVSQYLKDEQEAKESAWKQERIAELEAQKAKAAEAHVAAFNRQQAEFASKTAKLEQERVKIGASSSRAAKAGLVAKQAQIVAVKEQQAAGTESLTQKLASTQNEYQAKIAALENERDSLQKQLDAAVAENFNRVLEPAAGGEDLAAKLAAQEEEKRALETRVSTLEKQKSLLEASLGQKPDLDGTLAKLQQQLQDKTAQYDQLKKEFDARQAAPQASEKVSAADIELVEKKSIVASLERQLKDLEANRAAEAARAQKAQSDLEAARAEIAQMRSGLEAERERIAALQVSLERQKTELQKKAGEQEIEAKRLDDERAELSALSDQMNRGGEVSAAGAREKLAGIATGQSFTDAEVLSLKKEIQKKQADLERQAQAQAQQAEWLEREKAAVARAKSGAPVASLMASERAELDEARARIRELEHQAAQSVGRVADIDNSYQEGRAAATAGNAAALATLEERTAVLDAKEKKLAAERLAFDQERRAATAQITELKSENAKLTEQLSRWLSSNEPAAGGMNVAAAEQRKSASGWTDSASVGVPPAAAAPLWSGEGNRAAAFLDRIMTYHRPDGAKTAVPVAAEAASAPQFERQVVTEKAVVDMPRPAADLAVPKNLSEIETAAGASAVAEIQEAPSVAVVPVAASAIARTPQTIETVLEKSGVRGVAFTPVDAAAGETVKQWTAGGISGMYEQTAASGGNFDAKAQAYIDRYREDCPDQLQVNVGAPEATPAGTIAVADIVCNMPANAYTASLVFLENASGFSTVLHAGYLKDAAQVRSLSDNIAYTLGAGGGFAAPQPVAVRSVGAVAATPALLPEAPAKKLKFRIGIEAPASAPSPAAGIDDDFETVVVQ